MHGPQLSLTLQQYMLQPTSKFSIQYGDQIGSGLSRSLSHLCAHPHALLPAHTTLHVRSRSRNRSRSRSRSRKLTRSRSRSRTCTRTRARTRTHTRTLARARARARACSRSRSRARARARARMHTRARARALTPMLAAAPTLALTPRPAPAQLPAPAPAPAPTISLALAFCRLHRNAYSHLQPRHLHHHQAWAPALYWRYGTAVRIERSHFLRNIATQVPSREVNRRVSSAIADS